jgi:hypothetical protein
MEVITNPTIKVDFKSVYDYKKAVFFGGVTFAVF